MKKIYIGFILFFTLIFSGPLFAVTQTITVANFAFSPSAVTVNVGDTIEWMWVSGGHTTTSTSVPAGAATWNNPLNSTSTSFRYPVAVAGNYQYKCNIHSSMQGTITALINGINLPDLKSSFNFYQLGSSMYSVSYTLGVSSDVKLSLYDITGKIAKVLSSESKQSGCFFGQYNLEDLQKGIYIVELLVNDLRVTRRVVIE